MFYLECSVNAMELREHILVSSYSQGVKLRVVWHPGAASLIQQIATVYFQGSDIITGSKDKLVLIEFKLWRKRAHVK